MSKNDMTFIRHDLNMEADLAVAKLIRRFGYEGLGLYIHVLHIIYPQNGEIDKEELREELADCSEHGCEIFDLMLRTGLLKESEKLVYSARAKEEIQYMKDQKKKLSEAGRRGNEVRWGRNRNTNESDNNPIANHRTIQDNTIQDKTYKHIFIAPTLEQVTEYCRERKNTIDPQTFYDYFTISDWIDSEGKKVKNWKQKIITWERLSKLPSVPSQPSTRVFTIDSPEEREKGIVRNANGSVDLRVCHD